MFLNHRHIGTLIVFLALLTGCVSPSPSERLHELMDASWDADIRWSPTWATTIGDHRYDDKLSDLSLEMYERRNGQLMMFAFTLANIPSVELSAEDRLTADVFEWYLAAKLLDQTSQRHLMPVTQLSGFHLSLPMMLVSQPFATYQDYMNYGARLASFSIQVDQAIKSMREGIAKGYVPPRITVEPALDQINAHILDDPKQSEFYKPTKQFPGSFTDAECVDLAGMLWHTINNNVIPAYRKLHSFIDSEYLPACRETVGIWAVPEGDKIYANLVHRYTSTKKTPEEIHRLGIKELKRIHAEMNVIRQEVGFEDRLPEFMTHMRDDPQFRAPSGSWLMEHYAEILARTEPELHKLFGRLPNADCEVKEIESYRAASAPVAYYNLSAPDGSRPGYFYVNTYQPQERVTYTMEALTYHEAVPGHHLQFALHAEDGGLPNFRRHNYITVYCEGWALYTEGLGQYLGGYTDPLQRYGRLAYEAWRAARLVVDTGMHHFKWSRQRAIDYMNVNTGLARLNIEREVDRYIAWPGQALAYKIGEITIRDLRDQAMERLGDRFDLRAFHDQLLVDGPLPMSMLVERMNKWIDGLDTTAGVSGG